MSAPPTTTTTTGTVPHNGLAAAATSSVPIVPAHPAHLPTELCNVCLPADPAGTTVVPYKSAHKLEGKVVLISGGDSGIGRAAALLCALEGAAVIINYATSSTDASDTLSLIRTHCGPSHPCEAHKIDVSVESEAKECVRAVVARFGGVDVLFNCAGVGAGGKGDVLELESEEWMKTFAVNVHGMFFLTKAAIPHMKPGSSIINMSSLSALLGSPSQLDDSASKGAVLSFTRALSSQIVRSRGIRVNAIAAGSIETPGTGAGGEVGKSTLGTGTPMGRAGVPGEVAACMVFLASPESSYISGSTMHPNGGMPTNS